MLLTKFSNLHIIHTAGTNLSVADMLSKAFSHITNKMCKLQHKTLPAHLLFSTKTQYVLKTNHNLYPLYC